MNDLTKAYNILFTLKNTMDCVIKIIKNYDKETYFEEDALMERMGKEFNKIICLINELLNSKKMQFLQESNLIVQENVIID